MFILNLTTSWWTCPKCWRNFFDYYFWYTGIFVDTDEINAVLNNYHAKYIDNLDEIYIEFNTQEDLSYFILKYS